MEESNKSSEELFQKKYQVNFGHMDRSLEKLISEQTSLCGNLRTTLGDLKEQKTSELKIMREHLNKQVQLIMNLLHNMEQKTADIVQNAQHWIQHHLGFIQSEDTSVEALRSSIMELIQPPLQGISEQLRKAMMDQLVLTNVINNMIRGREYRLEVYCLETKDFFSGIEQSMAHYVTQRNQESERFATILQSMVEDSDSDHREMVSQLRAIVEAVQMLEERMQARQQRTNQSKIELHDGLNHMDALTANMAGEMQRTAGSLKKKLTKLVADEKQKSEELHRTLHEFVEKRMVAVNHIEHLREEAVSGCWSAFSSHEEETRQHYQSTEEQLRDHSEMLKGYLLEENGQTQALVAKVHEMAEVQESHLEFQRRSFKSFMLGQQDDLKEECSLVQERGQILSDELKKQQEEIRNFFSSE